MLVCFGLTGEDGQRSKGRQRPGVGDSQGDGPGPGLTPAGTSFLTCPTSSLITTMNACHVT